MLPPVVAGMVIPIAVQAITGWWLNSGRGVACVDGALFALAVGFGIRGTPSAAARLVGLWAGAQIGLTAYLFLHERGSTIFPLCGSL